MALIRVFESVGTRGLSGLFNDFYDYWAAAVLLNHGRNPYDIGALHAVQRAAGVQSETGTGYSYPLLFAELIRPLGWLTPQAASLVFLAVSLIAVVLAIGLLLGSIESLGWPLGLLGGAAGGLFPPIVGSLYFGQANLVVLLLLAIAYRGVTAGPMLALATAIKVYPATGFLAPLIQGRWRMLRNGLAVVAALFLTQFLLQLIVLGFSAGPPGSFLGPDTYWTNESINGWLSRLAIASTWTRPPLPGLPVEPLMLALVAVITAITVAVLRVAPNRALEGAIALSLWLGTVSAPKNSFWNFTPLLLCVVFTWTQLRGRWWLFLIGVIGWLLLELQAQLNSFRETVYQASPSLAWVSSVGLYGALILGAITAYVLLRPGQPRVQPTVTDTVS